jgi:prepilin-type N-terminal cleavage/methylation domain-containing protein
MSKSSKNHWKYNQPILAIYPQTSYAINMNRRGFTIVELIIVITIMAILLVLAVVNLRGSQISARDDERKADIDNLALHLEIFYNSGRDGSTSLGRYTSTGLTTSGVASIQDNLRDMDLKSVMAPGITNPLDTLLMAANTDESTTGVLPQPTINQYVYQPLQQNGTLCTSGAQMCQRFNLFYRLESDDTVYVKTSKNQ